MDTCKACRVPPTLPAHLAERPPSGPDWQHETTWDGYRTLHPHLKLTARGILIASKEEIRKRLGRSPGKGDAVAMSRSEGNKAAMARARRYSPSALAVSGKLMIGIFDMASSRVAAEPKDAALACACPARPMVQA